MNNMVSILVSQFGSSTLLLIVVTYSYKDPN